MNKRIYLGLALTAGLIVLSETSLAGNSPNILPVTITSTAKAISDQKKSSAFHEAMVSHYKALIAAEYGKKTTRKKS